MPEDKKKGLEKLAVAREAWELGLEVGSKGHLEGVGWVKSELRQIMRKARELRIEEEIIRKYERAKEIGKSRKGRLTSTTTKAIPELSNSPVARPIANRERKIGHSKEEIVIERISVRESLHSMISLMKMAEEKPEMKKRLQDMLAGISDIHDRLSGIWVGPNPRRTLEDGLNMLFEVGWLEQYNLVSLDAQKAEAIIEASSELARSIKNASDSICQPICNVIETIAGKAFGRPMIAIEKECIAQGKPTCIFKVFPRNVTYEAPPAAALIL